VDALETAPHDDEYAPEPLRTYRIVALEGIDGAGKSAVAAAVERELGTRYRVLKTRLSVQMGEIFRQIVDVPAQGRIRYQDVIPGRFRSFTYVVDAAVQFRYLASLYDTYDLLIFDRWLPTYEVYCFGDEAVAPPPGGDPSGEEWLRRLMGCIPRPDIVFYLRVDPRAAALRLAQRGDWTARHWGSEALLADLTRLDARYRAAMTRWPSHLLDANAPLPQVVDAVVERVADLLASPGPGCRDG
jgi:dTMP kinase